MTKVVRVRLHQTLTDTSESFPLGIYMRKEKILASGMGLSQSEENKSGEESEVEEEGGLMVTEIAWEDEESGKGVSLV